MGKDILSTKNAPVRVPGAFNLFTPGLFNRQAVYKLYQINHDFIDPHLRTRTKSHEVIVLKTLLLNKYGNNRIILFSGCILWPEFSSTIATIIFVTWKAIPLFYQKLSEE